MATNLAQESMKDILESLAKLTGLFSISVLILSVFHEVGFYYVIGNDFRHLLTTTDYFASVIAWIPETIYFFFIGAVFILIMGRGRWNFLYKYPDEQIPTTIQDRVFDGVYFFTLFTAVIGTVFGPSSLFLETYPILIWVVFYLWVTTWGFMIGKIAFIEALPREARIAMLFIPVLITNSYLSGVAEAYGSFFRLPSVYTIEQSAPDGSRHVIFLRSFDKGVLVRDPVNSTVDLIKWDRIGKLSAPSRPRTQSLFCKITGYWCDLPAIP